MTIWRVLKKHHVKPVVKRRKKSDYKLYNKEIPGDRVQLDVTKLAPKAYLLCIIRSFTLLSEESVSGVRLHSNQGNVSSVRLHNPMGLADC